MACWEANTARSRGRVNFMSSFWDTVPTDSLLLSLLTHKSQATSSTLPSSTTVLHSQWLPPPCFLETDHNHLASCASLGYSCCLTPGSWARGRQSSSQAKHRASEAVRISTSHCAQHFFLKRVVHKIQAILPVKEQLILGHFSWTDLQPWPFLHHWKCSQFNHHHDARLWSLC